MKRKIITTSDGSKTIYLEEWNEQYHSIHGAIKEAYHVFIDHGLSTLEQKSIAVLEIGFGTGLNALITYKEGEDRNLDIHYTGVEAYPVTMEEVRALNYIQLLEAPHLQEVFVELHTTPWNTPNTISKTFHLIKQKKQFAEIKEEAMFDLVYFDAFGARVQPELWTVPMFNRMFNALKPRGVLVTYSAKGSVRRAMEAVGFNVERLPGPPGKREMLRARKP